MNGYAFAISADDHPLAVVEADPQMANLGETKEQMKMCCFSSMLI